MNIKDIINEEFFSNESEDYFSDKSIEVGTSSYCHIPNNNVSKKKIFLIKALKNHLL